MPKSAINLIKDQIDESQHDIESIGIYIDKQDEASISLEQMSCLRGLQEMYRERILGQQAEILESELKLGSGILSVSAL
ncbi:hypothetical protein [Granulicella sp. L60]|uniref:hypothetical protein n=1 Tax=Granulicella sp. L60 TaxID=1641866 RepID=UPI00131E266C|nr:hypothetical protein [Granulicella sp. L60]